MRLKLYLVCFQSIIKGSTAHCSAQMKQIEREDFFYLLKFPESLTFLLSSQFVSCFLPYSKEDYSYIALPLTKAGAVTILMEYTRAPKGCHSITLKLNEEELFPLIRFLFCVFQQIWRPLFLK